MIELEGSCHCGAVTVRLETAKAPAELPVRVCGCSFCVKHRPRYTSDPAGHITVRLARADAASRYRFGHELADFLVCRTCGVFVGAFDDARGVLNLEVLARRAELTREATLFTAYDTEDVAARTARRAANWTPATVEVG